MKISKAMFALLSDFLLSIEKAKQSIPESKMKNENRDVSWTLHTDNFSGEIPRHNNNKTWSAPDTVKEIPGQRFQ